MTNRSILRSIRRDGSWTVEQDGKIVSKHKNQMGSELATKKLEKLLAKEGIRPKIEFYRRDGSLKE